MSSGEGCDLELGCVGDEELARMRVHADSTAQDAHRVERHTQKVRRGNNSSWTGSQRAWCRSVSLASVPPSSATGVQA
jgi:hypothetical protein